MVFNRMQSRALGSSAAVAALALAACSGGGGSANPTVSPTPLVTITPVSSASPSSSSTPIVADAGIAYLPDGGNGNGFTGIQLIHFEDTAGNLLPTNTTSTPMPIRFSGAVGPFTISGDGLSALAGVSRTGSPPFTLVQSVLGTNSNASVPVGTGYDVTQLPTDAPNATPTPGTTATPISSPPPVLSGVTSLAIFGSSTTSIGIVAGPDTTGFLGVTQLLNPGPLYGGFVPFAGQTPEPVTASRPHVVAQQTSTALTELLRGPSDLLAYTIAVGGLGYTFTVGADDTTLGLPGPNGGNGVMALSPADGTHALVGQTNPGDGSTNGVTLIEGLPGKITKMSSVSVGSTPRSIAITSGGTFAVVGTDAGFVVISGVQSGTLALVNAFAPASTTTAVNSPAYVGCDGRTYNLANVSSVGFSGDLQYLAALGNAPSANCASGHTASLVVVPFDQTTGTAPSPSPSPAASTTPAPGAFTANNVIAPPTGQDYLFVR